MSRQALPCEPPADADDWFAYRGSAPWRRAVARCQTCPAMQSCQDYALDNGVPDGIWGGIDGDERKRIWSERGGKPVDFLKTIDDAIRPLLQARRDQEAEWQESAFGFRTDPVAA